MYKIINITDKKGHIKQCFFNELIQIHPNMTGNIIYPIQQYLINNKSAYLCFAWNDDSNKVLRTSLIDKYEDYGNIIKITTRNSIYTLERID